MNTCDLPLEIFSGYFHGGHCQGIAVDTARKFIYYSFTTELVKTDLNGRLIGSVTGLLGHLGCIDFCDADGRVYGSLEYKNDAIGKGIPKTEAPGNVEETANDAVVAALNDRISDLKSQNERLTAELAEAHAAREREVSELRSQLADANARAAKLADRVAGIAEAQQAIAATPWWRRGKLAIKLLGAGSE